VINLLPAALLAGQILLHLIALHNNIHLKCDLKNTRSDFFLQHSGSANFESSGGWMAKPGSLSRHRTLIIIHMLVDYPPTVARQSAGRRDARFQPQITTELQRDRGSPRGRTAELRRPAENDCLAAINLIVCRLYTGLYMDARFFQQRRKNSSDTV
jgi:hypothetical protein